MNCKCNKLYIGILIGLLLPLITSWVIFYMRFGDTYSFPEFLKTLMAAKGFTKLLSVSVLPNLLMFMLALKLERLLAARGIVTATLLYAIVIIVLRFMV